MPKSNLSKKLSDIRSDSLGRLLGCGFFALIFALFSENKIMAFFIEDDYLLPAQDIFHRILAEYSVKTAFVAACDELFLLLCLDFHKKVELQAYIFGVNTDVSSKIPENENADFSEIDPVDLIKINRHAEDFFADITPE